MIALLFMAGAICILCGFREEGGRLARLAIALGFLWGLLQGACTAGYTSISSLFRSVAETTPIAMLIGYAACAVFVAARFLQGKGAESDRARTEKTRLRERPRVNAPLDDEGQQ
jgi:drug/metabolite transporter (DMT)-like permease